MTKLLVSVRSAEEANAAIVGGAALVDVKEPLRGALGPADVDVWRQVLEHCRGVVPLSAALGELLTDSVDKKAPFTAGFQFAKVGLAGCGDVADWAKRWENTLQSLPVGVASVAVVYVDSNCSAPLPLQIINQARSLGCRAVLFDTYDKTKGDLFSHLTASQLAALISEVRKLNMGVVLGGSLNEHSAAQAVQLTPDYLAVRGAVCRENRTGTIDPLLVRSLATVVKDADEKKLINALQSP